MKSETIQGHAVLEIPLESNELAEILRQALDPETDSAPSDRAKAKVTINENVIVVEISAEDLTALRAAMNSYLAWISGCIRTVESVTGQNP
jgi:tRNA threonylcarbamoyladenosine modification (KEOPS) complex  Pcc1 subunit